MLLWALLIIMCWEVRKRGFSEESETSYSCACKLWWWKRKNDIFTFMNHAVFLVSAVWAEAKAKKTNSQMNSTWSFISKLLWITGLRKIAMSNSSSKSNCRINKKITRKIGKHMKNKWWPKDTYQIIIENPDQTLPSWKRW